MSNDKSFFKITSVHRDDLEVIGYDPENVTDDHMRVIADKMANAYIEHMFWDSLDIIADHLNIPKLED